MVQVAHNRQSECVDNVGWWSGVGTSKYREKVTRKRDMSLGRKLSHGWGRKQRYP